MLAKDYRKGLEDMAALIPWYDVSSNVGSLPVTVTYLTLTGIYGNIRKRRGQGASEGFAGVEEEPPLGPGMDRLSP